MLAEALRVVEAARRLRLMRRGEQTLMALSDKDATGALARLLEEIERFDVETGKGLATPDSIHRPGFAVPPQLEIQATPAARDMPSELRPAPRPGMRASVDGSNAVDRRVEPEPSGPARPSAVRGRSLGMNVNYEPMEGEARVQFDADVEDFEAALDAIEDKLGFAIAKVGWNPRLRRLAAATGQARKRMLVHETGPGGVWAVIPVEDFSKLVVAAAEASLDQKVPEPPLPKLCNAPKPRADPAPSLPTPRPNW